MYKSVFLNRSKAYKVVNWTFKKRTKKNQNLMSREQIVYFYNIYNNEINCFLYFFFLLKFLNLAWLHSASPTAVAFGTTGRIPVSYEPENRGDQSDVVEGGRCWGLDRRIDRGFTCY